MLCRWPGTAEASLNRGGVGERNKKKRGRGVVSCQISLTNHAINTFHFLVLCPLKLAIMLNFNISKVVD